MIVFGPPIEVTLDPFYRLGPPVEAVLDAYATAAPEAPSTDLLEGTVENDLVAAMEPWLTDDLETFLRAIGSMFREVETYVLDEVIDPFPGAPEPIYDPVGWEVMLDPDRAPAKALPYLAQFVGERLPVGLSEDDQRRWIKDRPNQRRGTVGSIVAAAKRRLTGERLVSVFEREGGDPETLGVVTYIQETPDSQAVENELKLVVPVDLRLNYRVLTGQTWANVNAQNASWNDLTTKTWAQVAAAKAGGVIVGGG